MQVFYKFFTVIIISSIFITSCSNNSQDDIQENPIATCDAAIIISIDETLNESLEVSLTTTDKFDVYEIEYGAKGFQLGNGNKLTSIEKTKTIENLEVNSEYEIYVRGNCAAGYGEWFGPILATTMCEAGLYEGDVELNTQEDIITFGALCYTGINGDLIINGENSTDFIIDLSPLINLSEIKGALIIRWNPNLENLIGFENLTEIGALKLIGNAKLSSINSLKNLNKIDDNLSENSISEILIYDTSSLQNLSGLEGIKKVKKLRIIFNGSIETLEGLENLEEIEESLEIRISNLNSLLALEKLKRIGNSNKTSLLELDDTSSINIDQTKLNNLEGLENLKFVGGMITLTNNMYLKTLTGLENIEIMDGLSIKNNPALANLGKIDLSAIEVLFRMEDCNSIVNFQGIKFEQDNSIYWFINNCDGLTSFKGLEGLTEAVAMDITSNENLTSLDGLQGLQTLTGTTYMGFITSINDNRNLTDACALSNLFLNGTYESHPSVLLSDDSSTSNILETEDFINGNCKR